MIELSRDYIQFLWPFAFYFIFFIFAWVVGVFRGPTPNGSFCKAHFYSLPFYFLAAWGLFQIWEWPLVAIDFFLGITVYFMIHYAVVVNFFGLASRSVSSTLLVELSHKTQSIPVEELMRSYAGGKGFAFVKNNRLENMVKYGLVTQNAGQFVPTPLGARFYRLLEKTLGLWKMKQIGEDS